MKILYALVQSLVLMFYSQDFFARKITTTNSSYQCFLNSSKSTLSGIFFPPSSIFLNWNSELARDLRASLHWSLVMNPLFLKSINWNTFFISSGPKIPVMYPRQFDKSLLDYTLSLLEFKLFNDELFDIIRFMEAYTSAEVLKKR